MNGPSQCTTALIVITRTVVISGNYKKGHIYEVRFESDVLNVQVSNIKVATCFKDIEGK